MKNVMIFTNFGNYFKAYSLTIIVEGQIKMLCDNGYKPKVTVMEGFKPQGEFAREDIELCYLPRVSCHNEQDKDPKEQVDKEVASIKEKLKEY